MELVKECIKTIKRQLKEIEKHEADNRDELSQSQGPQLAGDTVNVLDLDQNLNRILSQQVHLKRIIDQDNSIQVLRKSLTRVTFEIEELRRRCTKLNADAIKGRQELAETHAKDLERYQMGQLRSIAEDYSRHQDILEQRKDEIETTKKEIEKEEEGRDVYLADVERKLERQLQDRQRAMNNGGLPSQLMRDLTDESNDPDIQLTSVDEYAPYGTAPHSRMLATSSGRGAGRGGRGKRRRN